MNDGCHTESEERLLLFLFQKSTQHHCNNLFLFLHNSNNTEHLRYFFPNANWVNFSACAKALGTALAEFLLACNKYSRHVSILWGAGCSVAFSRGVDDSRT
jgi:hypothetical protein